MPELSDIFLRVSGSKDSKVASIIKRDEERKEEIACRIDALLNDIVFLFQARISRSQGTSLRKIKTQDIGDNIRSELSSRIDSLREIACNKSEFSVYYDYFADFCENMVMNEEGVKTLQQVRDYNLILDVEKQMLPSLSKLSVNQLNPVLKYLVLSHVNRRLERGIGWVINQ